MKTCIVVGGHLHYAFVLHDKDIISYRLRTISNEATIHFHSCSTFTWFLEKVTPELEHKDFLWHKGIQRLEFCGGFWSLSIKTDIIPLTISPDDEDE